MKGAIKLKNWCSVRESLYEAHRGCQGTSYARSRESYQRTTGSVQQYPLQQMWTSAQPYCLTWKKSLSPKHSLDTSPTLATFEAAMQGTSNTTVLPLSTALICHPNQANKVPSSSTHAVHTQEASDSISHAAQHLGLLSLWLLSSL